MEVYNSKFWKIFFDEQNKVLNPVWNGNTISLTPELYKEEMEFYTQMVEKHRPERALINCMEFYFAIPPEIQEWTNNSLFPRILAVGVNKVAIIMPGDIIAQLGLEQVMDESLGKKFTTNYFDNEADAKKWLLAK